MNSHDVSMRKLLDRIEDLIETQSLDELRSLLADSRSSDVAEVVEVLDEVARQILFDLLEPKEAAVVLEKIDEAIRNEIYEELSDDELRDMVQSLPPDEAADIVAELPEARTEGLLDLIPDAESEQIEKLLTYEDDTAGGIMTPELVRVRIDQTIREAIEEFRKFDPEEDEVFYAFVVDGHGIYKGVVSVHSMLRYPRITPLKDVMEDELPTIEAHMDQEAIANIFRKNDLYVAPVVDRQGRLLGRITVDDVVDVMEEEAEEDVMVMAGTHPDEFLTNQPLKAASVRLPWLLTCMVSSMCSAGIIYRIFGAQIAAVDWACLLMFVPAIAAMGGNSGMQTSTVVVRGLATGDLAAMDLFQVFAREFKVSSIVSVICGMLSGIMAYIWLHVSPARVQDAPPFDMGHSLPLGLAVGSAMFLAIQISTFMGMVLPYLFRRMGIDPAISSGPLVTTANDMLSYLIYFSLALLFLGIVN